MTVKEKLGKTLGYDPQEIKGLKPLNNPGVIPQEEFLMEFTYKGVPMVTNTTRRSTMTKDRFESITKLMEQ